jgi:hypothetical protein
MELTKLLNWSEISRHITGGDRNTIRSNRIPKKHLDKLDDLFFKELPEMWVKLKDEIK